MISPDAASMILDSLAAGCDLATSARGAGVPLDDVRASMADASLEGRAFAAAVVAAADEGAKTTVAAMRAPVPPARAEVARATATHAASDPGQGDRWARVREEAAALAPGLLGYLLWVERRCVDARMHAMDPHWLWHFGEFYASNKFIDLGRGGLRAAKSDSVCRALVAESLLIPRVLESSLVGVCPVMSSNMREAGDRFDTITEILRACGLADCTGKRSVEDGGFRTTGGGQQALVIALQDAQGHDIEFRIYPASEAGAAGFTGIAGFGDELDLWGKPGGANPAKKVIEILVTRYTTQPGAKLHLWSATYDRASEHAAMIAKGDTPRQRVARLGVRGAAKDTADRARLAAQIGSTDPLLLAPADPQSTDLAAWVSNPLAPIEECYAKMDGDIRRMLATHGGRPEFAGKGGGAWTVEDWAAHKAIMRSTTPGRLGETDFPPLHFDDDGNPAAPPGRYRGL